MTQEKQSPSRDRDLGMDQPITRRDFLNGMAIGATAIGATAAVSNPLLAAALADPAAALRAGSSFSTITMISAVTPSATNSI